MSGHRNSKGEESVENQRDEKSDHPETGHCDASRDRSESGAESESTGSPPEYHGSWYRNGTMREEGRETVENQISWLERLNEKALGLLRFNAILLGLLVPMLSFLLEFGVIAGIESLYTSQMVIGVVTLVASTAGAGLTYTSSSMAVGVSDRDVETARRRNLTDAEVHDTLVESYASWIRSNRKTLHRNAGLVTVTVGLTITAIVSLSLGFVSAIFTVIPGYVEYTAYIGLVLLFVSSQYV